MKETDVHQMLTAGVGLKARGVCLHQLRGRGRELGWRTQPPPPPCAHSTGLGLGPEYNSVFQDAAQAGSPSLFGKGRGKLPVFLLLLPNRKMRMESTHIVFLAIFCFLCP